MLLFEIRKLAKISREAGITSDKKIVRSVFGVNLLTFDSNVNVLTRDVKRKNTSTYRQIFLTSIYTITINCACKIFVFITNIQNNIVFLYQNNKSSQQTFFAIALVQSVKYRL